MQRYTLSTGSKPALLHAHILVLVAHLPRHIVVFSACTLGAIYVHQVMVMIVGIIWMSISIPIEVVTWRVYKVTIWHDRILIRRFCLGIIEEAIYPLPGLHGLTRRQSLLDRCFNTGTIKIKLPDRTIHLTMLTPFSVIMTMFNTDYLPA